MSAVATYRQAITTHFLGPTDHRDQRIKVTCQAGTLTVLWDYNLDVDENHRRAVEAFCAHLARCGHPAWERGTWIGGTTHTGDMVWTDATVEISAACELAAEAARLRAEGAENP